MKTDKTPLTKNLASALVPFVFLFPVPGWASGNVEGHNHSKESSEMSRSHDHGQKTLYTCSMHPNVISEEPGTCPICKMDLVPIKAPSAKPKKKVLQEPSKNQEEKTLYTCSMHPHVISEEPGTCPICKMDLVPIKAPSSGGKKSGAKGTGKASGERKIKYWVAPMDKTYISDSPGKSPMGMDLVPVYEDEEPDATTSELTIDPVMVQSMGVRVAAAERGDVIRKVRTMGEVEVAESEESVVNLRFSGWIERIWADETEKKVKKGDKLFQIYSPEIISAQEELLVAVSAGGTSSKLAKSARNRLSLLGIPKAHISKVIRSKDANLRLVVRAPRSGVILHKSVVQGAKIKAGTDLYRIGNLDKIWVRADIYEFDALGSSLGNGRPCHFLF